MATYSRQLIEHMLQNNSLLAQLKQQIRETTPRAEGVIKATEKGFGFLETDSGESYFVPPPAMKQVLHGDRVEAVIHENGDKKSVEPEKLIEAGLDRFVARVQKREGRLAVVPDHPSIRNVLKARIKNSLDEDSIADGDWVVARLVRHPLKENDRGFFTQIDELGHHLGLACQGEHFGVVEVITKGQAVGGGEPKRLQQRRERHAFIHSARHDL